jgi:asparagine synthase (glutamine-hydrolysing)
LCGIVATVGPEPVDCSWLEQACRAIAHRGPDGEGTWSGKAGRRSADLGHRRLAILDPGKAGAQPMTTNDGAVVVTFNGELYNYPAIRSTLEQFGHQFRTRCDTEALLHAYRQWGTSVCEHLEGMFAFVLVDQDSGTVLAARDRLGIKPLYWARSGDRVSFASEPKALFLVDHALKPAPDPLAIAAVLTLLWVPHPRTSFLGVEKVPPGHQVILKDDETRVQAWWNPLAAWQAAEPVEPSAAVDQLRCALTEAVQAQLISDVPVGVFLSGGLDSCVILELMSRTTRQRKIPVVAVGYRPEAQAHEFMPDDARYARRFATRVPLASHHELTLDAGHWSDARELIWHFDDLVADPAAISMFQMSRFARSHAKVMLSGVGAEELFAGYNRYRAFGTVNRLQRLPFAVRRALKASAAFLPASKPGPILGVRRNLAKYADMLPRSPHFFNFFTYQSEQSLARLLGSEGTASELFQWMRSREEGFGALLGLQRATLMDTTEFLPNLNLSYVDKASMAASVEVRVPMTDERMLRVAATLPESCLVDGGQTKIALKRAAEAFIPREFVYRKKSGLGGPVRYWVANSMGDALDERITDLGVRGWVDATAAHDMVLDHRRGRKDQALAAWALYCLSLWAERFLDTPPDRWLS